MTPAPTSGSGLINTSYPLSHRNVDPLKSQPQKSTLISSPRNRFRRTLFRQRMDYIATLGRNPHNPRQIPTSDLPSQEMNDVIAVLCDQFFFVSDAQHELSKRKLKLSGSKDDLLFRLFEALEAEYADGWTLGYLLNTRILPFTGRGLDPQSLVGHHVNGYKRDGDSVIILELSDGEDLTILSHKPTDECAKIKMDHDLFWALHTLDGIKAVPRNLSKNPLLITEAATGVRRNRWGKEAGIVFGLKLEGMRAISFLFLAGEAFVHEDRVCGDVWLVENGVLREDSRMLHGGDEMVGGEVGERGVMEDERMGLEEDMRGLHGYADGAWD